MSLSKEPYKGVRDFYPEDQDIQNYIFDVMRDSAESFGYQEYNSSILEPSELYEAKSGEEIINEQTYTFEDRGGRKVTLRPEMTPSVARMVAARVKSLPLPLRWYSVPNLFRYERPQRGRLREHWQLNVDLFGSDSTNADVEVIELAHSIMKNFGLSDDNFEIRINDRVLLGAELSKQGLNEEQIYSVKKLLDKKDKIDNFEEELKKITSEDFVFNPEANDRIKNIMDTLSSRGVQNVRFEPSLTRGFDYYTGIVFEVFDTNPENNRSIFGGGRYDNLLEIFDEAPVPAVGFGMGDVVIRDVLETYNILPEYISSTDISICVLDDKALTHAQDLARFLREEEVNVSVDFSGRNVSSQIKNADSKNIPFVLCIGENEMKSEVYAIKELSTGEERELRKEEISTWILA